MTLKEAEDISCAVQNVFDSLATYVVFWVTPRLLSRKGFEGVGGDYGAEGRSAVATYLIAPKRKVRRNIQ
jgi:hypothetical protein